MIFRSFNLSVVQEKNQIAIEFNFDSIYNTAIKKFHEKYKIKQTGQKNFTILSDYHKHYVSWYENRLFYRLFRLQLSLKSVLSEVSGSLRSKNYSFYR